MVGCLTDVSLSIQPRTICSRKESFAPSGKTEGGDELKCYRKKEQMRRCPLCLHSLASMLAAAAMEVESD